MAGRIGLLVGGGVVVAALAAAAVLMLRPAATPSTSATVTAQAAPGAQTAAPRPENDVGRALIAQAEQLYNRGDTAGAASAYDKAAAAYRKAGDVRGEAAVAFGLGRMNHGNGQSDKARADFTRAVGLYQQANDAAGQARVLVAMGDLEKDTFHGTPAAKFYRQARDAWALVPEPKTDANVMLNIDRAPLMPAGESKARAALEQADKVFHNIGDNEGLGDVAMLRGALETNLGNATPAHAAYQTARNAYATADLPAKEGEALLAFARGDIWFGYNVNARDDLKDADTLFANDPIGLARVGATRGDLERMQGRLDVARQEYERAAAALAGASRPEEPDVRLKLGQVQAQIGDAASARRSLEAALAAYGQRHDGRGEAAASLELGLLALAGNDLGNAAQRFAAAAERFHAAGDARGEARALLGQGDVALKQDNPAAANTAFAASGTQFAAVKDAFGQVVTALAKGDAARAAAKNSDAASAYREAAAAFKAIQEPLADASRMLGQPPVTKLWLLIEAEERIDGAVPDPEVVRAAKAVEAANTAAFPGFSPEGRALLTATQARIAAATEFARTAN